MAGGCFEDGDGRWRWTWQEESGSACIRRSATLTRCTTLLGVCLRGAMNQACILRVCVCVCVCACRLPLLALWPRRKVQDSIRYPLNTNKLLLLESFWFTVSAAQLHTGGRGLSSTIRLWRGRVGPSQERRFRPARAHACRQGL